MVSQELLVTQVFTGSFERHPPTIREFSDAQPHTGAADRSRWKNREKIAKEAVICESSHEPVSRQHALAGLKPTSCIKTILVPSDKSFLADEGRTAEVYHTSNGLDSIVQMAVLDLDD